MTPRHPLALLAEKWRTEASEEPYGSPSHAVLEYCADGLESALRAQAEADKGLREALAFYADTENYRGMGVPYLLNTDTEEVEDDWGAVARAALAQAQAGAGSEGQGA